MEGRSWGKEGRGGGGEGQRTTGMLVGEAVGAKARKKARNWGWRKGPRRDRRRGIRRELTLDWQLEVTWASELAPREPQLVPLESR